MNKLVLTVAVAAAITVTIPPVMAEWSEIYSNSRGTSYLWYPIGQYFPYAYPVGAVKYKKPLTIKNWRYLARSTRSKSIVDCRDGRVKLRKMTAYSGRNLNGHKVNVKYVMLTNGLKVVPGKWYRYNRLPKLTRNVIDLACE